MILAVCIAMALAVADPITGVEVDPDVVRTLDYLGRRSPVFAQGQSALPGVGGPSPSSGPVGPSGVGQTLGGASEAVPAAVTGAPSGPDGAASSLGLASQAIGGAKSATRAASSAFQGTPPSTEFSRLFEDVGGINFTGGVETEYGGIPIDEGTGGPTSDAIGSELQAAGTGLSGASLAALVAQLVESGKISPGQAVGILQSSGGTASGLAATLGPTQAGQTGTALSGTIGPEATELLGLGGEVLGGAGALGSVALSLKSEFDALRAGREDPRQYAAAGGSELGLAAGGIIGSIISPGYGTLIGLGAGGAAGTAIGQAIARNLPKTHYMALREHWGEVAADAVNNYGFGIQSAASGGLPAIQDAMSQGYADGHVKAYLSLPEYLAPALGVPVTVDFNQMTEPQFLMLLKAASQTTPDEWNRWISASGDVPYLDQGRAAGVANATRQTAAATLTTLIDAFRPVLDQMPSVAGEAIEASRVWAAGAGEREMQALYGGVDPYAESLRQAGAQWSQQE